MTGYGTGLDASIGIATESAYNTFTAPTRHLPLTSETLKREKRTVQGMGLRGGLIQTPLASQRRISTIGAKGNVLFDVQNGGMNPVWYNALGSASSSNSGAAYTWVHTLGGLAGRSLCAQVGRPSADAVINVFNYTGGKVSDWELTVTNEALIQLSLGLDFADERTTANGPVISSITQTGTPGSTTYYYRVAAIVGGVEQPAGPEASTTTSNATLSVSNYNVVNFSAVTGATGYVVYRSTTSNAGLKLAASVGTTASPYNDQSNTAGSGAPLNPATLTTPSYGSTLAPFSFTDVSTLTLGGSAVAAVKKLTVKGENPIKDDRFYLGSAGIKAEQLTNGYRGVSGTLEAEFTSMSALYAAFARDASLAFVFKATSPTIIATTSTPYSIQVDIPALFLDGETPVVAGPDILTVTVPFTGLYDGSNSAVKITQVTADTALT